MPLLQDNSSMTRDDVPNGEPVIDTPTPTVDPAQAIVIDRSTVIQSDKDTVGKWVMLNIALPILLLAGIIGGVIALGSVQPSTRPPLDQSRVGRLKALPGVLSVPVESLNESGKKLRLNADGTVVPFREVVLATEVAGRVVEKSPSCEAGKYVTAGTVLLKIDPTDYELEVQRLERVREQEYEALGEVDQEMVNAGRSMEIADAEIVLQRREVTRLEKMQANFASRGEIDQARRSLLQAEQQKVGYQNQIDLLKQRRSRLEAAERLAATQLRGAEVNLARTTITAPIDGVIAMENAELNTFVARGSPVVTMEDTTSVEVSANLRSDQLFWVLNQRAAEDDPLSLSGATDGDNRSYKLPPTPVRVIYQVAGRDDTRYVWQGTLLGYDGIGLDEETRTVPVRVLVSDPRSFDVERQGAAGMHVASKSGGGPTALVRGMFVDLQLILEPAVPLVLVPAEALRPGSRVWEFIPDESVLGSPEPNTDESPVDDADGLDDADGFVAADWMPGRLVVHERIRPVDVVDAAIDSVGPADDRKMAGKFWICEVPPNTLTGDSLVITSPLGSVNATSIPVRAMSASAKPTPVQPVSAKP